MRGYTGGRLITKRIICLLPRCLLYSKSYEVGSTQIGKRFCHPVGRLYGLRSRPADGSLETIWKIAPLLKREALEARWSSDPWLDRVYGRLRVCALQMNFRV